MAGLVLADCFAVAMFPTNLGRVTLVARFGPRHSSALWMTAASGAADLSSEAVGSGGALAELPVIQEGHDDFLVQVAVKSVPHRFPDARVDIGHG